MSQRDLVAELRAARMEAPAEVRERVRLIAANATTPPRRLTWRRGLVLVLPIAAALAAAVVLNRPTHNAQHERQLERGAPTAPQVLQGTAKTPTKSGSFGAYSSVAPAPARARVERYGASLSLMFPTPEGVSKSVKRALAITRALGGYAVSVHADVGRNAALADLTVKVPRAHVQEAIRRLSALGTISSEQVDIQDLQAGVDATDRKIARLQRQLAALRAQPTSEATTRRIAAFVAQIARIQRGEAAAIRSARFATISLELGTRRPPVQRPHHHGPLHGLVVAFKWIGIGLAYAAALGAPLLLFLWLAWILARTVRRRREDALLSRP
jgi:Domain of unknown function (DUF4349)